MTVIEFRVYENRLSTDPMSDIYGEDEAVLETTCFLMPVRFTVRNDEVLGTPENPWREMRLIGFATLIHSAVTELHRGESRTLYFESCDLVFLREANQIRITTKLGRTAEAGVQEFELATKRCLIKVRDFLIERVPTLRKHPIGQHGFQL